MQHIKQIKQRQRGFTLIELMVVVGISAVLIAVAVPSFTGTMARNETDTEAKRVVATLNYMRASAISTGRAVTAVPTGGVWTNNWTVCVDVGIDGACAGDVVLRNEGAGKTTHITVIGPGAGTIIFLRNGVVNGGAAAFSMCDSNDLEGGWSVNISAGGQVTAARVIEGVLPC